MLSRRRNTLTKVVAWVVIISGCSNNSIFPVASAKSSFFNRKRNHPTGSSDGPLPPVVPPLPPPTPSEEQVQESSTHGTSQLPTKNDDGSSLLTTKLRSMAKRYLSAKSSSRRALFESTKLSLPSQENRLRLFSSSSHTTTTTTSSSSDWKTTTRLKGGSNPPVDVDDGNEAASSPDEVTTPPQEAGRRQAFLDSLRFNKKPLFGKTVTGTGSAFAQKVKEGVQEMTGTSSALAQKVKQGVQETSSKVGPSFFSALSLICTADRGVSFLTLYAISLFGASCGFYLFLYFITVGYALGVTLPLVAALFVYNVRTRTPERELYVFMESPHNLISPSQQHRSLSYQTFFHSAITIAWGIRIFVFFLWREYISWPVLHQKVVELQSKMDIPFSSRLFCWFVYSFFYVSMVSSHWSRLRQPTQNWGLLGYTGLLLQIAGLSLETIADLQKNGFKSRHRHAWCNVGVWKWSTHPNYLGEGLFWWGTYLAHGFSSKIHSLLATVGLVFLMTILQGSTRSLSHKHREKYGDQPEFCEFQRSHSIWGPKRWWWWLQGMEELSRPQHQQTAADILQTDYNVTSSNTTSTTPDEVTPPVHL